MGHGRDRNRGVLQGPDQGLAPLKWALVTGEYPPQTGGVSDYCRVIANALATQGDEVVVFAPPCDGPPAPLARVEVSRLPGRFGLHSLATLDKALRRARPDRLIVQYVPHAFGYAAANVPFSIWLATRARPEIVFHEVAMPWSARRPAYSVLAAVQRLMAFIATRRARRVYVSTVAWDKLLARLGTKDTIWLPVPSTLPVSVDRSAVATLRASIALGTRPIISHFGTFGENLAPLLRKVLDDVLPSANAVALLVGRGSSSFRSQFVRERESLASRVVALDSATPMISAQHLAAADVAVQPYPDGATTRRTTLMASLALGIPVVTNAGPLTESIWRERQIVELASSPKDLAAIAIRLLADPGRRAELAHRGAAAYEEYFAVTKLVRTLRAP